MSTEEPVALIRRKGRWEYNIVIRTETGDEYGPAIMCMIIGWTRYGRKRAEAKGRRELARYRFREQRRVETWTVAE